MKKYLFIGGMLLLSLIAFAGTVEEQGKTWLDQQKDPPAVNVNGSWSSGDWGTLDLTQAEGSRDVSGHNGKFELTGVVSGKRLFLLFHKSASISFCATLSSDSDHTLTGTYSYRVTRLKFGHGLCQEKSYGMRLEKK